MATWRSALQIATADNLKPADALHIACCVQLGVDEFVTAERPDSPLGRCTRVRVITI